MYFRIFKMRRRRRRISGTRKFRSKSNSDFLLHKESALIMVISRLEYFNKIYNFKFNKISIRNQSSRWGSCSRKGNINFNYRIALLPAELADYIIVHELCHLGEFNHSDKFWKLVEKTMPDWPVLRRRLRGEGKILF